MMQIQCLVGAREFALLHNVQTGSGAHQPPVQLVQGALPPVKWLRCEVDHSHLVLGLRKCGAMHLLFLYAFIFCGHGQLYLY